MKKLLALALILALVLPTALAQATECDLEPGKVEIFFFWREDCTHCKTETEFLQGLEQEYGDKIEVHYLLAKDNVELFKEMARAQGASTQWLPATFIPCCNWYIEGFSDAAGREIREKIDNKINVPTCEEDNYVIVPFLGKVETGSISLPLFTITLGLLDGFNPCAIWVLMFLLSLLIYSKSRKRILFIGGIFVVSSALIYFLFMAAWLNLFMFIGYTTLMRTIIAVIALVFGVINVKDFFAFKKGISLSIPDSVKPKLFEKMRAITQGDVTAGLVVGTILLAIFVNLIELACTLGLPAIYTRILTMHNLDPVTYYLYLALYNIVYVVPLAIIVGVFTATMGGRKLSEKHGRILKLVSGALMVGLGLAMIFAPELLMFG